MATPTFTHFEEVGYKKGWQKIAGIDEAGRGPLAGPVVAAACMITPGVRIDGVKDSKQLTKEERTKLYQCLTTNPNVTYAVGIVEQEEIDQINILQASLLAMKIATEHLPKKPEYLLVDGNQKPPIEIPMEMIIQGDTLSQSIAAASILAKYIRDQIMCSYHILYPEYNFHQNMGYATRDHLSVISKVGPCKIHRRSFDPIKTMLATDKSFLSS